MDTFVTVKTNSRFFFNNFNFYKIFIKFFKDLNSFKKLISNHIQWKALKEKKKNQDKIIMIIKIVKNKMETKRVKK
jgi:hypothetical protein